MDAWEYPAMLRLIALGYVNSAFLGLRPWTRDTFVSMLHEAAPVIENHYPENTQAEMAADLYAKLTQAFAADILERSAGARPAFLSVDRLYTRDLGIAGEPLRDSYHFGATIINDDGRPYGEGFNAQDGFLAHAGAGRFTLAVRGEYERGTGHPLYPAAALAAETTADQVTASPTAGTSTIDDFRLLDAYASGRVAGHEISVGKREDWWGPAEGGAMAWSDNAEPIYALRIDRVPPLHVPGLSRVAGPFRYEALFGALKGQTFPRNPWVHAEKFSFKPTANLEFGFSRVVVFAGEGHVPLTFGSFWHSFASFSNVSVAEKNSRMDPGARHSAFDFSYRLPFGRDWATLYADSIVHDDTSPVDAPRHAGFHTGLYLPYLPGLRSIDFRAEASMTDLSISRSHLGQYLYWESQYRQVYANHGQIFGDWVGREGKGGQAFLRWWIDPRQSLLFEYRHAKVANDFMTGGVSQTDAAVHTTFRLRKDVELKAWVQGETWSAPVLAAGGKRDVSAGGELTFFAGRLPRR
jgi:hypothetical protein